MKDKNKEIMNYLSTKGSFSINIGLQEGKEKKYVILKPYINITKSDEEFIKMIYNNIELQHSKITVKKSNNPNHKDLASLNIQNFEDIEIFNQFMKENIELVISNERKLIMKEFIRTFELITRAGQVNTEWKDEFIGIIEMKLRLNANRKNINKNRFSLEEWIGRVKNHLGEKN